MNEFAKRIRKYRTQNAYTLAGMADLCTMVGHAYGVAVSAGDIANYEAGRCFPSNKKAFVICKVVSMRLSTYTKYTGKNVKAVSPIRTVKAAKSYSKPRTQHYNGTRTINITIN